MPGLLLVPIAIVLFALRALIVLARVILWACRHGAACIITAALIAAAAWLIL